MEVYLDNGATTMVDPKVVKVMNEYMLKKYGNASSLHEFGREPREALDKGRKTIAKALGAKPDEIFFTSGGTESDNWAVKGIAYANRNRGDHIITSKIEHPAVYRSCEALEKEGFRINYLPADSEGFINPDDVRKTITSKTILISIMHANNEIGTIQNIEEIGKIAKNNGVYFHTDAVQSFMKSPIKNADLVSIAAHKIHGPKGVGALYIKRNTKIAVMMHGGPQEMKMRAGTENIPGIAGFSEAVRLYKGNEIKRIFKLRDKLMDGILSIKETRLNGPKKNRLCNNINVSFRNIEGESIGAMLNVKGICTSTGSACASRSLKPSHVLKAIGLTDEEAHGSVRFTLGRFNTEEQIDYTLEVLPKVIEKLKKISPYK